MSQKKYTREELRRKIPSWYRWWLHVGLIALFCAIAAAVAIAHLPRPRLGHVLFFLGALVFINLSEYWLHRGPLHTRMPPRAAHFRHTIIHHAFFGYDTMAVDDPNELCWVIFPAYAFPGFVLITQPFFWALRLLAPVGWDWTFLLAVTVYYFVYEIFHTAAHLPEKSALGRSRIVRAVTHHHRVHHDPALMRRYNFNFAIPIFDVVFGTRRRDRPAGQGESKRQTVS